jgi:hypothetical protein
MEKIENLIKSKSINDNFIGLMRIKEEIDVLSNLAISGLDTTEDLLVYNEYLGEILQPFFVRLNSNLLHQNNEIRYWAAFMLYHYGIEREDTIELLISYLKSGEDKFVAPTVILFKRKKNPNLGNLLKEIIEKRIYNNKDTIQFLNDHR